MPKPASAKISASASASLNGRPPITLLVIVVGDNIIFDPSQEELAVAETALAVSVAEVRRGGDGPARSRMLDQASQQDKLGSQEA